MTPRVYLIHGLGGDPADYDGVRARLPADWSVEAPALGGDFEDAVADAAAWLRAGPGVVVGHSMGGHVALAAARAVGRDRTRLVLLAPGGVGPKPPEAMVYAAFGRAALLAMPPDAIERLSRSRFGDPHHPAADRLVAERLAMRASGAMHGWATQVERHVGGVLRGWIGDARDTPGRLVVVHGARDSMVPRAPLTALAEAHPRAVFHGWDAAGHMLPHEAPEAVAALVAGVIAEGL